MYGHIFIMFGRILCSIMYGQVPITSYFWQSALVNTTTSARLGFRKSRRGYEWPPMQTVDGGYESPPMQTESMLLVFDNKTGWISLKVCVNS